ncbi:MAG: hypothetical protein WC352_07305 [Candidatus Omnitrophota bacterium]|jgi:hypothetical protein
MEKNMFTPFFIFMNCLFFLSFAALLNAQLPQVNQEEDLRQKYHEAKTAKHQTLEAPLATSGLKDEITVLQEFAMAGKGVSRSHSDNLLIRELGTRSMRVSYDGLDREASLSWKFDEPRELNNRWFRMVYSGTEIPQYLTLKITTEDGSGNGDFDLFLEPTSDPAKIRFKLPNRAPFGKVTGLEIVMDPSENGMKADFMILDFGLLLPGEDPLRELPKTSALRQGR